MHAWWPGSSEKGDKSPMNLELWMVMRHHEGAENQTLVLCKSSKYSQPLSHRSSSTGSLKGGNHVYKALGGTVHCHLADSLTEAEAIATSEVKPVEKTQATSFRILL